MFDWLKNCDFKVWVIKALRQGKKYILADLSEADLSEADLSEANLSEANLRWADLRWADLRWADLREANISEADLREADLREADLREADLREANLSGANLSGANLWCANLSGADIDYSCWPLWCGSIGVKIDERQARQLLAHAFNVAQPYCQPTEEQKAFMNEFHRIQSGEFPRFAMKEADDE